MNDLATIMNYEQLKSELNEELSRTANSFVRIGYLLKLARDERRILAGSGYVDVNEFASKEYGLDKTQVSRFIRINDRFSIDGNSTQLLPEYEEYGSAKLSIMLTLPDEINKELSPDYSKSDIQAIKEEYEAEQKITDLEVMMEETDPDQPDDFITMVVKQLNDEHSLPIRYFHASNNKDCFDEIKDAYIPDGDKTYSIRIAGRGRYMVSMKEECITITNMRDPSEKHGLTWELFREEVTKDEATRDFTEKKPEPEKKEKPKKVEKAKVAPVQPKSVQKEAESVQNEAESVQNEPQNAQKEEKEPEIEKVEGEVMNPPEAAGEEIRKLERIANDLRALADQFEAGTGGNLYSNPIEELEGMIDEINALPGELIPIVEDAIRRIKPKEDEDK